VTEGAEHSFDYAPPGASALFESLRGIGYSPEAAIADLIDNSVAAGARHVWVDFLWHGTDSVVRILDDGRGMDEETLVNAMRPGGRHPLLPREPEDLGRFGLGLKTASLSQGRVLGVSSRTTGGSATRCWDLDYVAHMDQWRLLHALPDSVQKHATIPDELLTGTVVVIGCLDRLLGDANAADGRARFLAIARRVEWHLAMTFHRFLEGPQPRLALFIGGRGPESRVTPWDPFLQLHPATIATPPERLVQPDGAVEVQGFVLPHRDKLTADQFERAAGPDGWLAHEGFFVYRNRRLLVPGGWLGLGPGRRWTRDDVHRLARIRLDLLSSGDEDWKVDIRKSSATPPPALRPRLQGLAEQVRREAREVFAYRGGRSTRRPQPAILRAWSAVEGPRGTSYRVDRAHPAVQRAIEMSGSGRQAVNEMISILEQTLPVQRIWLDTAEQGDLPPLPLPDGIPPEEQTALRSLYDHMRRDLKVSAEEARRRLAAIEPFAAFPTAVAQLPDEPS
jgi:hypothetical protein